MLKSILALFSLFCVGLLCAQPAKLSSVDMDQPDVFQKIGSGICLVKQGVLQTRNAYAAFGDTSWRDYRFEFDGKAAKEASKVLIWAGFRAGTRDNRYVLALKGGAQNDLYLSRLGYMGADEFLALRHLDFKLEKDVFYHIKVIAEGDRIRVFLNGESLPRIDIRDKDAAYARAGRITLGGGWLPAIYKNLKIGRLAKGTRENIVSKEYQPPTKDKEAQRILERKTYRPLQLKTLGQDDPVSGPGRETESFDGRKEISLNGKWLFAPGYMVHSEADAVSPQKKDDNWHIMPVPSFWNPDRIWLFGERYGTASKGVSDSYYQKEIDRCNDYTFDYKKTNVGWYRQWLDLPTDIRGKHTVLSFDAISKTCEIWINGKKAGSHIGMFGSFKVDATGLLKPGRNLVAVKVFKNYINNIANPDKVVGVAVSVEVTQKMLKDLPHGFYDDDPAGIWQPVSLIITNPLHIKEVFIRPDTTGAKVDVTVENDADADKIFSLATTIGSGKRQGQLYQRNNFSLINIKAKSSHKYSFRISGLHPKLWSPEEPNLYDFTFTLKAKGDKVIDHKMVRSGFKSFVIKDGYFYLNGRPYWLRGANQTAMPLAPNDTLLAKVFTRLMHKAHIDVTRTHTAPYTETWMNAADEYGVGISYEGSWPWLMLGDSPIPDKRLLDIWEKELLDLVRKYRNHPSLLMWTMNNEMKFYLNDPDIVRAKAKMRIISKVVKTIRKEDPEHPIVFDSNYDRKQTRERFGAPFMDSIDDGDIDDIHQYTNWYDESIFDEFNGRFEKRYKLPGRPLVSQEMSTGYPDETGHATRFYTFVHQNPSSLVGKFAYAYQDPRWFMQAQSFITKELGEALRRSNPHASGILQFSLATWFSHVADARHIEPNKTYYAMKKVLQPVLVSAELWGRHFYGGDPLPTKICIVNDQADGKALQDVELIWRLTDQKGKVFATGKKHIDQVLYYGRTWIQPEISIPDNLPDSRIDGKLVLELHAGKNIISANDYDLVFATKKWISSEDNDKIKNAKVRVLDGVGKLSMVMTRLHLPFSSVDNIQALVDDPVGLAVLVAADSTQLNKDDLIQLQKYTTKGGRLLIIHGAGITKRLFPKVLRGMVASNQEIANLEIPESPVFAGLTPMDIRYFNNQKPELPTVLENSYQITRNSHVTALASSVRIHGYLNGKTGERMRTLDKLKGFPVLLINTQEESGNKEQGHVLLTTLNLEKGDKDPVAARLLSNMIDYLTSVN